MGIWFKQEKSDLKKPWIQNRLLPFFRLDLDCHSRLILQHFDQSVCFTLDEGVCLWGKGLCCPGGGGEEVFSVPLPVRQCTHTVISANRPEDSNPAGPREEAEDFRASDSGILAMRFDASIH